MTKSQYRTVLLLSIIFGLLAAFTDSLIPSLLPEGARDAFTPDEADIPGWKMVAMGLLMLVYAVAGIASTYGLFFFRGWAPKVALVGTIAVPPLAVLLEVSVLSGWASAFGFISSWLWGAALLVPFLSEYKGWFGSAKSDKTAVPNEGGGHWPEQGRP